MREFVSGWVRGDRWSLVSRLGEDEDRKLKTEAKREKNFETSDKSKEKIQRLLLFLHPPFFPLFLLLFLFLCFIFFFWQ